MGAFRFHVPFCWWSLWNLDDFPCLCGLPKADSKPCWYVFRRCQFTLLAHRDCHPDGLNIYIYIYIYINLFFYSLLASWVSFVWFHHVILAEDLLGLVLKSMLGARLWGSYCHGGNPSPSGGWEVWGFLQLPIFPIASQCFSVSCTSRLLLQSDECEGNDIRWHPVLDPQFTECMLLLLSSSSSPPSSSSSSWWWWSSSSLLLSLLLLLSFWLWWWWLLWWLVGWSVGGLVGWWVGGLVGWWVGGVGGLVGWWVGGLVGWWVGGLVVGGWVVVGGLVGWWVVCLVGWLVGGCLVVGFVGCRLSIVGFVGCRLSIVGFVGCRLLVLFDVGCWFCYSFCCWLLFVVCWMFFCCLFVCLSVCSFVRSFVCLFVGFALFFCEEPTFLPHVMPSTFMYFGASTQDFGRCRVKTLRAARGWWV